MRPCAPAAAGIRLHSLARREDAPDTTWLPSILHISDRRASTMTLCECVTRNLMGARAESREGSEHVMDVFFFLLHTATADVTAAASERSASTQVSQPTSTTTAFLSVYPVPLPPKALVALAMMPRVSSEEGFCPSFFLSFSRCSLLHFLPFYSSQLPPQLSASLSLSLSLLPFPVSESLSRERKREGDRSQGTQ